MRSWRIKCKAVMLRIHETSCILPFFKPHPLTALPLIYHREHLFPYTSYGDTELTPVLRSFRMMVLENEFLRVEIMPELGGRVYSLYDKRIEREILFSNPVVKPVRILPIWGFISGGIEFNFPIAHSPTSVAEVGCKTGQIGDYGFVRVGEREARTGMEWVVELGLLESAPVLIQRTALRNHSGGDHPWMLWSVGAVRSTQQTEFVHPPHRVLVHDNRLLEMDWPGDGLNWDRNFRQMTALFWKPGGSPHFGVFHHDMGFGLMHLAELAQLPGKKVWTYGHGPHRRWGEATTIGGFSYAEIESGPLNDQSEKPLFPNGVERRFEEMWIPVHKRDAFERVEWPKLPLPPMSGPWLGWAHSPWQREWEEFRNDDAPLPRSTVPTGIDLGPALRRELGRGNHAAAEPLALWLAFHHQAEEALPLVENARDPNLQRIAGLILWKVMNDPACAVTHLESGPLDDPVAISELDELYVELGLTDRRVRLLAKARCHRLVIERQADLALVEGNPAETLRLLASTEWPREHQRYVRTELWRRARTALGEVVGPIPDSLNEDNLARFGAYWPEF